MDKKQIDELWLALRDLSEESAVFTKKIKLLQNIVSDISFDVWEVKI